MAFCAKDSSGEEGYGVKVSLTKSAEFIHVALNTPRRMVMIMHM